MIKLYQLRTYNFLKLSTDTRAQEANLKTYAHLISRKSSSRNLTRYSGLWNTWSFISNCRPALTFILIFTMSRRVPRVRQGKWVLCGSKIVAKKLWIIDSRETTRRARNRHHSAFWGMSA